MRPASGAWMLAWLVAAIAYVAWQDHEQHKSELFAKLLPFKRAFRDNYIQSEVNVKGSTDADQSS